MDRSNLFIGAGVLVGLGALAYWLMQRKEREGTQQSQSWQAPTNRRIPVTMEWTSPTEMYWDAAQTRVSAPRPSSYAITEGRSY